MTSATVSRAAPAKVNLYLHVTGRCEDGYHELDSLVVFADVGDTVSAVAADELTLSVGGPFADALKDGDPADNLVLRAARELASHAGVRAGARLHLEKNLPVASGIGGGSADAAATLKVLVELWGLELHDDHIRHAASQLTGDRDTARALETLFKLWRDDLDSDMLHDIALKLGADVPVCLEGRAVFMGGIGEKLSLAPPLPHAWLVLANPGVALSTPAVFEARSGDFSPPARFTDAPGDAHRLAHILKRRDNDLAAPAIALAPVIQDVLDALDAQDGALLARMSGSGATCFALFATADAARIAAKRLQASHPGWWVANAEMLDAPPWSRLGGFQDLPLGF